MAALLTTTALLALVGPAQAAGGAPPIQLRPLERLPAPQAAAHERLAAARPAAKPAAFADRAPCAALPRPTREVSFAPGEELTFELSVAGMMLGRMEIKVGRPRTYKGKPAMTLFGRGRTSGWASSLTAFSGRYMVLVDPDTLEPFELRTDTTYGTDPRLETTLFGATQFATDFRQDGRDQARTWALRMPGFDMLTLLYLTRRLALEPSAELCHEVYADKRLWRVEGEVRSTETIETAAGERRATRLDTRWTRMPHGDFDPKREPPRIDLEAYFAADGARVPLLFYAKTKDYTAKAELVRWVTKDGSGDAGWALDP
jgi:hypothetical protein